jgi:ammonia channel protein AmtB
VERDQPVVAWLVHGLVMLCGIAGAAWLGWQTADQLGISIVLACLGAGLLALGWFGIGAHSDPELKPTARVHIPGKALIFVEVALIIAGGAALWMAWHRAAGEAYMTLAFIDMAVRYSRIAMLWRDAPNR